MKRKPEAHPRRAEALRLLADGVSPGDVARRLDLNPSTVRMWKTRAKPTSAPPNAERPAPDLPSDLEQLVRLARATRSTAARAITEANQALGERKPRNAQSAMITAGIALDKMAGLFDAVAAAEGQQARLATEQAELMAAVIRSFLEALDVPLSAASRRILAQLLRQAGAADPIVASPADVAEARAELREHLAMEIRKRLRDEAPSAVDPSLDPEWLAEHRGLPAPRAPHPDGGRAEDAERGELAKPQRKVRVRRRSESASRWRPSKAGQAAIEETAGKRRDVIRFDRDGNILNPESPL